MCNRGRSRVSECWSGLGTSRGLGRKKEEQVCVLEKPWEPGEQTCAMGRAQGGVSRSRRNSYFRHMTLNPPPVGRAGGVDSGAVLRTLETSFMPSAAQLPTKRTDWPCPASGTSTANTTKASMLPNKQQGMHCFTASATSNGGNDAMPRRTTTSNK